MENNADGCHKKKNKIIWGLVLIFISILSLFVVVGVLNNFQLATTYMVEYIDGEHNTVIQTYYKGDKILFPEEPERKGYMFKGWSLDINGQSINSNELVVDKEMTFYAIWEEKTYSLTFDNESYIIDYGCQFEVVGNSISFTCVNGDRITLVANEKEGYTFSHFELENNLKTYYIDDFNYDKLENSKIKLNSKYNANTLSFVIEEGENYKITNNSHFATIKADEVLLFTLVLNDSVNNSLVDFETTSGDVLYTKVGKNYNVSISNFTKDFSVSFNGIETNDYVVSYVDGDNCFDEVYYHGSSLELPTLEKEGYILLYFTDELGKIYTGGESVCNALTLKPVWKVKIYNVTFPKSKGEFAINYNNQYITTEKSVEVEYGESVDFEIVLSNSYSNSNVSVVAYSTARNYITLVGDDGKYSIDVNSNLAFSVEGVELNKYNIIADGVSYGVVSYGSSIVVCDSVITINDISTNKNITINMVFDDDNFHNWFVGDRLLMNSYVQEWTDSDVIEIKGRYSKTWSSVSFDENGGNVNIKNMILVEGENYTLPTPTKDGYVFAGWFVRIVETNKVVDLELSESFQTLDNQSMIVYAGWIR